MGEAKRKKLNGHQHTPKPSMVPTRIIITMPNTNFCLVLPYNAFCDAVARRLCGG